MKEVSSLPLPQTKKLFFRTWCKEDLPLAKVLWLDPKVTNFVDVREQLTPKEVEARLLYEIDTMQQSHVQYWPVFLRSSNEFIGCCGLKPKNLSIKRYEIGFHICSKFWGKGFATEAANRVIEFAFTSLHATSLFAGHHPENSASKYMLEKLSFRYTHHEFYLPTGLEHPSYLLTKAEWHRK